MTIHTVPHYKYFAIAGLTLAVIFLCIGAVRTFKVYDAELFDLGIFKQDDVSERALVIDATFTGTVRRDGKLLSLYDRAQPLGKKACPT